MPKNTKHKAYYNVGVPKDSHTEEQLEKDFIETGIPKSHLLHWYARQYIDLFINGGIRKIMPSSMAYAPPPEPPQKISEKTEKGERKLSYTNNVSDEDLDAAFGL